ncbi:hypothetical protein [Microvirga brassicacearum]|nr:hypothetical protein [Microvirga brassicacearum]
MWLRILCLALAAIALLSGLCGGMWRLGWTIPHGSSLAELHGPLLISGLFGTLIGLERAVALGRDWSYAAPALSGLGTLTLLAGAPTAVGAGLFILASATLAAASLVITAKQPAVFTGALLFGALTWFSGNVLWLIGNSVPDVVGWWLAFLILTVAGERLELSRLVAPKRGSEAMFLFAVGLLILGAQNGLMTPNGAVLYGLALVFTTTWLLRHDIASHNLRQQGQTRFSAACMMSGYVWLGLSGVALVAAPPGAALHTYDFALHAVLIGFALSMVFGHALIILPAVTGIRIAYRPFMYAPLALLHASLVIRGIGDALAWQAFRQWSGIVTILAIVSFALTVGLASKRRNTEADRVQHRFP